MTFIQDNKNLNNANTLLRPPPFGNFLPGFPNILPGSPAPQTPDNPSKPPGINVNLGTPPNYIPAKDSPEVKSLNSSNSKNAKAISPNSISFCLFKFTYIWETNGNSYWAFLFEVDKGTVSGLRWFRGRWAYFGIDVKKIDSFVCYRDALPFGSTFLGNSSLPGENNFIENMLDKNNISCTGYDKKKSNHKNSNCNCSKKRDSSYLSNKTEYTIRGVNATFSRVLASVNTPEIRDDFIVNYIDDPKENNEDSKVAFPCKQARITTHRIVLEITYPNKFSKELVEDLNKIAYDSSLGAESALKKRKTQDFLSPFDVFEEISENIATCLNVFTLEFNNKIRHLKLSKDVLRNIDYKIIKETIEDDWHVV